MSTASQDFLKSLQEATAPATVSTAGSPAEAEVKAEPDASAPLTLRNLFFHHNAHPVVLNLALNKAFGPEWMTWEPETLWSEIRRVFQTQISELARSKIQAVKTLNVAETPWLHWQVFEKVCQVLNNNLPNWGISQAPQVEQLFVAVDTMRSIRAHEFSEEVKLYMAAAALHDDVHYLPPPLDFLDLYVAQPVYVCRDCGNRDSALFHDGICDTCTQKFDHEQGLSQRPKEELLQQGRGKNVEVTFTYDPRPIKALWEQVRDLPIAQMELEETPAGTQVAKLAVARDYAILRRLQLVDQLTALRAWLETQ